MVSIQYLGKGCLRLRLYIVGIGPGDRGLMVPLAKEVLGKSDIITGYTVYVDLIKDQFPEKTFLTTPMKQEVERCKIAIEEALKGQTVSIVCSGDAGIYGMAGLVYELMQEYNNMLPIEVVPGITAANAGAAILGSPLTNDFAVISLSDLLTPREQIQKRLEAAAIGDFVICLYNPASKKRQDYLNWACGILLKYKDPQTVCGCVKNIGRDGEIAQVLSLEHLQSYPADMFTTVYVGNSQTRELSGKMVTLRGYKL